MASVLLVSDSVEPSNVVSVGVVGAGGRMGREVCRAVCQRSGLELVAAVDPAAAGRSVGDVAGLAGAGSDAVGADVMVTADLESLVAAGAEVVIDFTDLATSWNVLALCAESGRHAVIGSTGFTAGDLEEIERRFAPDLGHGANCLIAANFAIGAVLMMRFAAMAAPWFPGAEIVELHHDGKLDAPSGTALRTAESMALARAQTGRPELPGDATTTVVAEGARGATGPGGVRIHSVRLPGLVAHQEVLFGAHGQGLTIRHDSYDRASFMDGVLLAVESVPNRPGLTVGLEPLLGL